jgi:cytoskeletal protein CcmA (bactofilin family)
VNTEQSTATSKWSVEEVLGQLQRDVEDSLRAVEMFALSESPENLHSLYKALIQRLEASPTPRNTERQNAAFAIVALLADRSRRLTISDDLGELEQVIRREEDRDVQAQLVQAIALLAKAGVAPPDPVTRQRLGETLRAVAVVGSSAQARRAAQVASAALRTTIEANTQSISAAGAAATSTVRSSANETEKETLIPSNLALEGTIQGSGHVRIAGRFKGDVSVEGAFYIDKGGIVIGDVRASKVYVDGELHGDVLFALTVYLQGSGVVIGDIRAEAAVVSAGACLRGRLDVGPDILPDSAADDWRPDRQRSRQLAGMVA